jgi:hypothetical protein
MNTQDLIKNPHWTTPGRGAAPVAQDGDWVMVPKYATHDMINAATASRKAGRSSSASIYRAMLAAAPLSAPKADERGSAEPVKDCNPEQTQKIMTWQPIKTAPRDGTNILIAFGRDGVSQAKYVPGLPDHPWQFLDTNDGITWLVNYAKDGLGGPSHWKSLPQWPDCAMKGGSGFGSTPAELEWEQRAEPASAEDRKVYEAIADNYFKDTQRAEPQGPPSDDELWNMWRATNKDVHTGDILKADVVFFGRVVSARASAGRAA